MGVHGGGNFWSFLASISPFESWRKYVMFRHKRDQDHRYRDAAEERRLNLENEARELENDARKLALLEKQIKILKQNGATEEQIEPLCHRVLSNGTQLGSRPVIPPKQPLLLTSGEEPADDTATEDDEKPDDS
jgi:hypothetical protein